MRLIVLVLAVVGTALFPKPADAPRWEYVPPAVDYRVAYQQKETQPADRFLTSRSENAAFLSVDADLVAWTLPMNAHDTELIARVIYAEARGEPFKGKVAVGAVICNRARKSGMSIEWVVTQPGQFVLADRTSPECIEAARVALGEADPTGGALYFWSKPDEFMLLLRVTVRIGGHTFGTDEEER